MIGTLPTKQSKPLNSDKTSKTQSENADNSSKRTVLEIVLQKVCLNSEKPEFSLRKSFESLSCSVESAKMEPWGVAPPVPLWTPPAL